MSRTSESYEEYIKYTKKLEILGYPSHLSWVKIEYRESNYTSPPEEFIVKDINIGQSGVILIPDFVTSIARGYRTQMTKHIKIIYHGNRITSLVYLLNSSKDIEVVDLTDFYMGGIKIANRLFMGMSQLKQIKLPEDFGCNLMQADQMFVNTDQLVELNLRDYSLDNLVYYTNFIRFQGVKKIHLGKFGQQYSERITNIVNSCKNLEELTIEELNIQGARQLYNIVINCQNIKTIKINTVGEPNKPFVKNLIINCNQLETLKLTGTIDKVLKGERCS